MTNLLEFDPEELKANFARAPFALRHHLTSHPLLSLDRIAVLADALPADQVENNRGDLPEVLAGGDAPQLDLAPGDIVREIAENRCWMVLKRIEWDPEYAALLNEALDELDPFVMGKEGGTTRREAFLFISAPDTTTPWHFDPEHNLLLQVHSDKAITVGDFDDHNTEQEELERYYAGGHRNIDFVPNDPRVFAMSPGDGVYVPVHAPHMVRTAEGYSISLSITFYTGDIVNRADTVAFNARLRRLGLAPRRPGERPAFDRAKAATWASVRAASRPFRSIRSAGD